MKADECHRCGQGFMAEDLAMQQEILTGYAADNEKVYTLLSFCRACWMHMMVKLSSLTPLSEFERTHEQGEG